MDNFSTDTPAHPSADVPDRLSADDAVEQRWRARFSAIRIGLPDPAQDAPDRAVFVSNQSGSFELHTWDVATGEQVQATNRPDGTISGTLTVDGSDLWWFDDESGDEFGRWRRQPFGTAGPATDAIPDVEPGYSAGLALGAAVTVAGFADDEGSRIHLVRAGTAAEQVYRHEQDANVGALSRDETIWVLQHSEAGDTRYPDLRAYAVADGSIVGELSDGQGKGLHALDFSPIPGDQRLLVGHERRGRDELLIWDLTSGTATELPIDLPGDLDGGFFLDGTALVVLHTHAGRTTLHRLDLTTNALTDLAAEPGTVSGAVARPDGSVWYRHSSAAHAASVRTVTETSDATLLEPPGGFPPDSQPLTELWVDGPGGRIHAFTATPLTGSAPYPTVCYVHGGPAVADDDSFDATRAAWLDAGFAVLHVNYRGSTGYGSAWRDALTERIGHVELADIAAVHDAVVASGIADPRRSVIVGHSWGGFLALLAIGTDPGRWQAAVAGSPVADYVTAYADEMEPLRAYDRALFGGSPEEVPDKYRDSSPISYLDAVRTPVLVFAGENDPRTPIRQIELYLDALRAAGKTYRVYRYDAGHGSMVVAERIRQVIAEIHFARTVLDLE